MGRRKRPSMSGDEEKKKSRTGTEETHDTEERAKKEECPQWFRGKKSPPC